MSENLSPSPLDAQAMRALEFWKQHDFYTSAVVLGLDMGLEGIGVCVRSGPEIIYAKTWQYDVPEAARLEGRRQKRAWRHCRSNRVTRLHRLKQLFAKHGLPWHADRDPELLNSDPYILRHRAVKQEGNGLASAKAVGIAIRHCVTHRGYEYDYYNDEGAYPWGDATEFKKVIKELSNIWLAPDDAEKARLDARALEWSDVETAEFDRVLKERTGGSEKLEERLAQHGKGTKNHLRIRAKGEAFPRAIVWEHLKKIARRHAQFITDLEGFLSALAVHPKHGGSKDDAIFFYHRKTPLEMREHFKKKRARCPYAVWLGLGDQFIAEGGDIAIRRFRLLEFATTRDVEIDVKASKSRVRVPLSDALTKKLLEWIEANPTARTQKECAGIVGEMKTALENAHGGKITPATKSELNDWFFKILRDLLAPNVANRRKNAGMSTVAAEKLFDLGTAHGHSRDAVNVALSKCRDPEPGLPASLYEFRRQPQADLYGVYPQVEFLLGQRVKKAKTRHGKTRGQLAHPGKLQQLFARLAPQLGGRTAPEFCIVETAKDLPRNLKQKKERETSIKENEERRKKLFPKFGIADDGNRNTRTRLELFDQQDGRCPFTGEMLPMPGTAEYAALDVEHLFPETKGGLTINENLVLTSAHVNRGLKKDRTPRQFAAAQGISFDHMVAFTAGMRWGKVKRDIFAWDSDEIPPFGNTTRTAQLARQLHAQIADWMSISGNANEVAAKIGTPSGFLTAACRREWSLEKKDRADLTHHLVDAVILAHIPPQLGQNYLHSKSIFLPRIKTYPGEARTVLGVLPVGPAPETVATLVAPDASECPVERHRSTSPHRSLHDQSILGVFPGEKEGNERQLRYRKDIDRQDKKLDAVKLEKRLIAMGVTSGLRPSRDELQRWLTAKDAPAELKLRDGSVIRATYEDSDQFKTPFGFTCRLNSDGDWQGIRIFKDKFDAMELWRDVDKKGRTCYVTQRRPGRPALQALLSLGLRWFRLMSRRPGWAFAADHSAVQRVIGTLRRLKTHPNHWNHVLRRTESQTLLRALVDLGFDADGKVPEVRWAEIHSAIWGKPVTADARPALKRNCQGRMVPVTVRKGDTFLLPLNRAGDVAARPEDVFAKRWYRVSAINSTGKVEFRMLLEKPAKDTDGKIARKSDDGLRPSLEKSAPADLASLVGLPSLHDSPPHSAPGKSGPARPERETDLRLE